METPIGSYPHNTLSIMSPVFEHGGEIPVKYTCDGENINPPLAISEVPPEAASLLLIVEDPDVPKRIRSDGLWDHWLVWNIPAETNKIEEDAQVAAYTLGMTTGGSMEYSGPCPPDGEHRYFFRLLALETTLSLRAGASKEEVLDAVNGHVIDSAELLGRYTR